VAAARRGAVVLAMVVLLAALPAPGEAVAVDGAGGPLVLRVVANGASAGSAPGPTFETGATIDWSYRVTNSGIDNLWALYLWHDGVGAAECPDGSVGPGETVRCTASSTTEAGEHHRAVQAWAWDDAGSVVAAERMAHYAGTGNGAAPEPSLDLEAFVKGEDADDPPGVVVAPGTPLAYRYRVRNTGNVSLLGLWVHDEALGTITCPTLTLAPGQRVVCAARRPAETGAYASVAEARAWDASGSEVSDRDLLHYVGAAADPGIGLEGLVDGFEGDSPPGPRVGRPGATIPFSYVVTNTGGALLTRVRVRDVALGSVTCPHRRLAPGASMTCHAETVARLGEFASEARVSARAGTVVLRASDPIYYHVRGQPRIHHLDLEVTVNGAEADTAASGPGIPVGAATVFEYVITYTGNNIVYNVTIQDPFMPGGSVSCSGDRILEAGESLRCLASTSAVAGPYASLVTAVSWDADGRRVAAEDWVHYYGMA